MRTHTWSDLVNYATDYEFGVQFPGSVSESLGEAFANAFTTDNEEVFRNRTGVCVAQFSKAEDSVRKAARDFILTLGIEPLDMEADPEVLEYLEEQVGDFYLVPGFESVLREYYRGLVIREINCLDPESLDFKQPLEALLASI